MDEKNNMQEFAKRIGQHWDNEGYPILPVSNQPERSKREDAFITSTMDLSLFKFPKDLLKRHPLPECLK